MFDHTNLQIWQRANALSIAVDRSLERRTKRGPAGLAGQLSRSCASIASNISEGAGYNSPAQTARFIEQALGSAGETENHLARCAGLEVISLRHATVFIQELREIRRMTVAFRRWVLRDQ